MSLSYAFIFFRAKGISSGEYEGYDYDDDDEVVDLARRGSGVGESVSLLTSQRGAAVAMGSDFGILEYAGMRVPIWACFLLVQLLLHSHRFLNRNPTTTTTAEEPTSDLSALLAAQLGLAGGTAASAMSAASALGGLGGYASSLYDLYAVYAAVMADVYLFVVCVGAAAILAQAGF